MAQPSRSMFINLPPPSAAPDTPEMPGTPTSTTTSLSALSTTAIKDGQRGHLAHSRHSHQPSTTSLEAERADRISRLAGLERVSTLRPTTQHSSSLSPQTTPTSSGFPPQPAHAYFDARGQPTAATKMSTVGTASATESDEARTQTAEDEDDMMSDANYRESGSVVSNEPIDDDQMTNRSVGDRMSDDGEASLVGFGEGAGSTISGPIYQRRPIPGIVANGTGATSGATPGAPSGVGLGSWAVERSLSGLSDSVSTRGTYGGDTPVSVSAIQERRDARMVDGVTMDGGAGVPQEEMFVDTTNRGGVPASQFTHPNHPGYQQQHGGPAPSNTPSHPTSHGVYHGGSSSREAAERILRERLDHGEGRGGAALGSPSKAGGLGTFYFEDKK